MALSTVEYRDKYVFIAEWYNLVSEVVKEFLLSFYPHDETLELYDVKYRRMFLRRTQVPGIHLKTLYIGSVVTIFSRQIKIVDYANESTKMLFSVGLQKIFAVIKPDGVDKVGDIISCLEKKNFKLTRLKMGKMTKEAVVKFYAKREDMPPLPHDVVSAMTSGPSIALEVIGENGVKRWLETVGPEDPDVAKLDIPDSLRAIYGTNIVQNCIHASENPSDYAMESDIWFAPSRHALIEPCHLLSNTTCCVIKPHTFEEGIVGDILSAIKFNGFRITAMEMFYLSQPAAELFYEVYKGVVPEYSSMVSQLASGPCLCLEIIDDSNPCNTALNFRNLVGPTDPVTARVINPESLRAKFGTNAVLNAVHCTDLPEDAALEVEYFFKILKH